MPNLSKWNIRGIQYDVTEAQLRDAIAQPYSNTSTYAVGDYCLYNGTLYKCTTAISTAEEWTGAHWAETTLGQELTVNNADNINIIESLGPDESDLVADNTYAIGDLFTINGVLYKATAAIAKDGAIIVGTNCTTTDMASAMQENCVADVQLNGTSIINNNIANIPSASYESLGVVKVGADYGISSVSAASGRICIIKATDEQIKAGAQQYKPIVSSNQHAAAFYGLAKAAGDTTQANSDNAVGTYTDGAKSAIRTMIGAAAASDIPSVPVTAVQVNGTSIVSNGVANVPIATDSSLGVVSIMNGGGIYINPANGAITTSSASSTNIKQGTDIFRPISPSKQHEAVFYGLAKVAGDSTQSASSNAVGTYTDDAKTAIRNMLSAASNTELASKVDKTAIENAGLITTSYTTWINEFTVTTATTSGYISPRARASVTGRFNKRYKHRVTFNGTEYVLATKLWYSVDNNSIKVYEYLGNLSLYISNTNGVTDAIDDVPFIIISDLNDSSSIDVLTSTAGTYTISIDRVVNTLKELPKSLIYSDEYVPFAKKNNDGTYNGFSVGVNELTNSRGTMAFGYGNKISNGFSMAFGAGNNITAQNSMAFGFYNKITGGSSYAFGYGIEVSDSFTCAFGDTTIANASSMIAMGKANVASNTQWPTWTAGVQYYKGDYVNAEIMPGGGTTLVFMCTIDHISSGTGWSDDTVDGTRAWTIAPSNGDTAFVIGNGAGKTLRSNAIKFDFAGSGYFGNNLYVKCDSNSQNGIKVATVNDLNNYVQLTDYASTSAAGIVKINEGRGIGVNSSHELQILSASGVMSKAGANWFMPIVPAIQDYAVFYGLAKAAGADLANQTVTFGTYPDTAKLAIQRMLGLDSASVAENFQLPYIEYLDDASGEYVINGEPNIRYVLGGDSDVAVEVTLTAPSLGTIDVIFNSGTTPTVLTVPEGTSFPEWFDYTSLETNRKYEIIITDGSLGSVMSWPM